MFDFIKGVKTQIDPVTIIVENPYYGLRVLITQDTYQTLLPEKDVKLYLYTQLINDTIFYYGFATDTERNFFKFFITVSGIGPRLAIRALSHSSYKDIYHAIITDNTKKITELPGIGQKTAQKIILELKDKVKNLTIEGETTQGSPVFLDAFMALENFGFEAVKIRSAMKILESIKQNWELQELIKELLKVINKK